MPKRNGRTSVWDDVSWPTTADSFAILDFDRTALTYSYMGTNHLGTNNLGPFPYEGCLGEGRRDPETFHRRLFWHFKSMAESKSRVECNAPLPNPALLQHNSIIQRPRRRPSHDLGRFGRLPIEMREKIFDHLLPPVQARIYLTCFYAKRADLAKCLMSLRLSSKEMQQNVLCWWWRVEKRKGFINDPYFGLINPLTTTWIFQSNRKGWEVCLDNYERNCSWEHHEICDRNNCLKRAINLVSELPLASRELIRHVNFYFAQYDQMLDEGDEVDPNEGLLQLLEFLPRTKHLEVFYYEEPSPPSLAAVVDSALDLEEEIENRYPIVPVSYFKFHTLSSVPPPSVCLFNMWPTRITREEFGFLVPPTLLSVWVPYNGTCTVKLGNELVEATAGQYIGDVLVVGPDEPTMSALDDVSP